jgi:hypothetical protein
LSYFSLSSPVFSIMHMPVNLVFYKSLKISSLVQFCFSPLTG